MLCVQAISCDLNSVTVGWELFHLHKNVSVSGFEVYFDGKPHTQPLAPHIRETVIENLVPGACSDVMILHQHCEP